MALPAADNDARKSDVPSVLQHEPQEARRVGGGGRSLEVADSLALGDALRYSRSAEYSIKQAHDGCLNFPKERSHLEGRPLLHPRAKELRDPFLAREAHLAVSFSLVAYGQISGRSRPVDQDQGRVRDAANPALLPLRTTTAARRD